MRHCTKCQQPLPVDAFGKSRNGPAGLNYWCKACVRGNAQRHREHLVTLHGKDTCLANRRDYYALNKDRINKERALRQQLRREHFTSQSLKWQKDNPAKVQASKRKHRYKHHAKVLAYTRLYHRTHKAQRNAHLRARKRSDPAFKLRERLRSTFADKLRLEIRRTRAVSHRKQHSVMRLVGCSVDSLITHLESQFQPGMRWENWGRGEGCWHIDHIRPIASFNLSIDDELRACWHFTNLRPLWSTENLKKGARYSAATTSEREVRAISKTPSGVQEDGPPRARHERHPGNSISFESPSTPH